MRKLKWTLATLGVVGLGIQLVPYGRSHTNPPIKAEPAWDSPRTRELVARACFDCHSNETRWPWYTHVAPASWLVQSHVEEGREHLNFSEWDRPQKHAGDAAEEVEEGEMPMTGYLLLHPEAKLGDADRAALLAGLRASFGESEKANGEKANGEKGEGEGHGEGHHDHDD